MAIAKKKGFVKEGKMVAKHAELLAWLKSEMQLGHANAIILYLRVSTNDPKVKDRPA